MEAKNNNDIDSTTAPIVEIDPAGCTFTEEQIGNCQHVFAAVMLDSTPGWVTLSRFKEMLAVTE